jgi:hypothetical protein
MTMATLFESFKEIRHYVLTREKLLPLQLFLSPSYMDQIVVWWELLCVTTMDDLEKQMPKGFGRTRNPTNANNKGNLVRNYFHFKGLITGN